jgi:hypothetical protein
LVKLKKFMATKHEYRVSTPGVAGGKLVIDNNGSVISNGFYGNIFFVDYTLGQDSNDGRSPSRAFKTIAAAYAACVTNNNDMIVLLGQASHVLTAMLTVSKSRITIIGVGPARAYGQVAKITMGVTTAATDVFMIKNTGVRNAFMNIKFSNGNTVTENVAAVGEGGEYALYENCEFYDSTELDSDTHAELVLNGDSAQFINCTLGSLADAVSGNKIRPAVLMTKETVGAGLVSRDILFKECRFWKKAGGTATAFIKIAADADIERFMEIKNCTFSAAVLGAVPAVAIDSPTLTNARILLSGDTIAVECTKIATAVGVFNGTPARVATATIGIQAT